MMFFDILAYITLIALAVFMPVFIIWCVYTSVKDQKYWSEWDQENLSVEDRIELNKKRIGRSKELRNIWS